MPGWEVQMSAKPGLGNLQALLKLSHFFCCALCLLRGTCSVAECSNHSWAPKVQLVPAEHQGRSVQTKTQLQRYNSPLTAAVSWQNCCCKSAFSWVSCFACRHVHEHSIPQSSTKLALSDSSFSLFSRSAASCELLATCTHRNSGHCRERAFFCRPVHEAHKCERRSARPPANQRILRTSIRVSTSPHVLSIVCLARLDPLEQLAFDPVTFSRLQGISAGLLQLLLQGQVATNGC